MKDANLAELMQQAQVNLELDELRELDFEALKKERVKVTRKLNGFLSRLSEKIWDARRIAIELREDELEVDGIEHEQSFGTPFKVCSTCGKNKPLIDEFYGYLITGGRWKASCKRCNRDRGRSNYAENPEPAKERANRHQEWRKFLGCALTEDQKLFIRTAQNDQCAYCGVELNGHGELDHYLPANMGGDNSIENRVFACYKCNRNKGRKSPGEFLQYRLDNGLPIREYGFYDPANHEYF